MAKSDVKSKKQPVQDPETVEKELEEIAIVRAPDGGYGWIIVISSFLLNMIVDGVIFTVGKILIPAWMAAFNISNTSASLTMSILSGFYFFVGPISSVLCNVFGCRRVAIAGSIIAAIGFLISIQAPNIYVMYISFGIIGGAGFGMMYLPAIVIISQYFATKRSFATGIAVCGSGIGTSIFALLNDVVYKQVGEDWSRFLLYTAFITILGLFASLLLKPLRASKSQIEKVAKIVEEYEEHKEKSPEATGFGLSGQKYNTPFLSSLELHTAGKQTGKQSHNGSMRSIIDAVAKDVEELNRPLSRMDIFYSGSTTNLHVRSRANTMNREEVVENLKHARELAKGDVQQVYLSNVNLHAIEDENITTGSPKSVKQDIIEALRSLLDKGLLASPSFLTLAFSGTLTLSSFFVPFIFLPNQMDKLQPPPTDFQRSLPLSLIGGFNILARIGCGYIADRPQVSALLVNNVALFFAGLATVTVPFYTEYWHFIAYTIPFSIGAACFAALRSVICLELVGLEKLSNAFGILLTFMGVGATIGTPIAAALKDLTGNFDTSFYIMGSIMAISGAICFPLPQIRQWEQNRSNKTDAKSTLELQGLTENA